MDGQFRMRMMIRSQKLLASAATITLLLTLTARTHAQANVSPRNDYAAVAARLESIVRQEMADKDLPAFSIALVDGNQIVWAQGFGYQDPEHKVPATAHTVYRVGSVSKLFTDIGIMQMVGGGKSKLDAAVKE